MNGFSPINKKAFDDLIEKLPKKRRLNARSLLVEILFRTLSFSWGFVSVLLVVANCCQLIEFEIKKERTTGFYFCIFAQLWLP